MSSLPYREGILAVIVNRDGDFLLMQPQNYKKDEWNFLGGGIEDGETPQQTLWREIEEEIGITREKLEIDGQAKEFTYDFPEGPVPYGGKTYKGARRHPFVLKFTGNKEDIKLNTTEIRQLKWVSHEDLAANLKFPGQYETAIAIIEEFGLL